MIYVKNCIAGEAAVINERYVREITEKCATERGGTFAGKCSFHVGGEIALCVIAKSAEELIFAVEKAEEYGEKYVVLGNMTNILPPDALYDGTVIVTSQMCNITAGNDRFKADAGFSLTKLSVEYRLQTKNANIDAARQYRLFWLDERYRWNRSIFASRSISASRWIDASIRYALRRKRVN